MTTYRPCLGALTLALQVAALPALAQQLDHWRPIEPSTRGVLGAALEVPSDARLHVSAASQDLLPHQVRFGAYPVLPATAYLGSEVRRWGVAPSAASAPAPRPPWGLLALAALLMLAWRLRGHWGSGSGVALGLCLAGSGHAQDRRRQLP